MTQKQFDTLKEMLNRDLSFAREYEKDLDKNIKDTADKLATLKKESSVLDQNIAMLDQSIKNFEFYTPDIS
jgi:ferritin-like metal-binding protein YciE